MNNDETKADLKQTLIFNGLQLLNQVGYDDFSIRKVALMSGVSHAAPYKHFKNKSELIAAIGTSVFSRLKTSMLQAVDDNNANPSAYLCEMGIKYVEFMVENPEHMKFLFFTMQKQTVKVVGDHFEFPENGPFSVFHKAVSNYLDSVHADPKNRVTDILSIWSGVHGLSVLIVEKSLAIEGDYREIVSKMISNRLR